MVVGRVRGRVRLGISDEERCQRGVVEGDGQCARRVECAGLPDAGAMNETSHHELTHLGPGCQCAERADQLVGLLALWRLQAERDRRVEYVAVHPDIPVGQSCAAGARLVDPFVRGPS